MDTAPQERGIPAAPFVTDVAEFIGGADQDVMPTLQKFQEAISKYKFMEISTTQRRKGLEQKIPDIAKTLQMVEYLKSRRDAPEPTELTFELNDTLFARATLDPIDKVHLWLGVRTPHSRRRTSCSRTIWTRQLSSSPTNSPPHARTSSWCTPISGSCATRSPRWK